MDKNRKATEDEMSQQSKDNSQLWAVLLSFLSLVVACIALYYSKKSTDAAINSTEIAHLSLSDQRKKDSIQAIENGLKDFRDSLKFERQMIQEKVLAINSIKTFDKQNILIDRQRQLYEKQVLVAQNEFELLDKDMKVKTIEGYFRLKRMSEDIKKITRFLANDSIKTSKEFANRDSRLILNLGYQKNIRKRS